MQSNCLAVLKETIPEIRLTESKDGEEGNALFRFNNTDTLLSANCKEIKVTYLYTKKVE